MCVLLVFVLSQRICEYITLFRSVGIRISDAHKSQRSDICGNGVSDAHTSEPSDIYHSVVICGHPEFLADTHLTLSLRAFVLVCSGVRSVQADG